uniref:Phospholipase D3 n=1 Tax=Aceria tosichella TaxID=561515 RepID=A0A6G1SHX3_9ACAR
MFEPVTRCDVFLLLVSLVAMAFNGLASPSISSSGGLVDDECKFSFAQSIPDGLVLPPLQHGADLKPTHEVLVDMIDKATSTIRIASFYMELTPQQANLSDHETAKPGFEVREAIKKAGGRNVNVEIIVDRSNKNSITNEADIDYLKDVASIKRLNIRRLLRSGILHSKFIIVDNSTFYLGSANFDWRSYSQVKEIGVVAHNCPVLAQDLDKIFQTYSVMSEHEIMPELREFPEFRTSINLQTPLITNGVKMFLAGSPPAFNGRDEQATGRSGDIDALLHLIYTANHTIDISVMNYSPQEEYGPYKYYWPRIDNALREAAVRRHVRVRLLFSRWSNSKATESMWYKSLNAIQSEALEGGGIFVKLYEVPALDDWQKELPYARVKHDKYMLTDTGLWLGTSNWAPGYFTKTCGVSLVMEENHQNQEQPSSSSSSQLIQTMRDVFERDFNSEYAHELPRDC